MRQASLKLNTTLKIRVKWKSVMDSDFSIGLYFNIYIKLGFDVFNLWSLGVNTIVNIKQS
jgi:hypothetical protein